MSVPPSLVQPELEAVWSLVRIRLERAGEDNRGRVKLPALSARTRQALQALVDAPIHSTVDLGRLEEGLVRLGVGSGLVDALEALGHPVSDEPARRRAAQRAGKAARDRARSLAAGWDEPWAGDWVEEVIRARLLAGRSVEEAEQLVGSVRKVLDHLAADQLATVSRTDLAAKLLGSSHALDDGSWLGAATTRALHHLHGDEYAAAVWERAGAHTDLVSGPALTWRLPIRPDSGLHGLSEAATAAGVPLHLTRMALQQHPISVSEGADILAVENPRVVEAAAQRTVPFAVVATNGNASGTVRLLLDQLLDGGATVRYHGDFDPAGLAICGRMARLGLEPWRMTSVHYGNAVEQARRTGVDLPVADRPAGRTSWDPTLQDAFNATRSIVHEERLLDELLEGRSPHR